MLSPNKPSMSHPFRNPVMQSGLLVATSVVGMVAMLLMLHARLPFYAHDFDPSYIYLSAFINLNTTLSTPFVDNPGYPTQLLGSFATLLYGVFTRDSGVSVVEDMVHRSEAYLMCAALVYVVLLTVANFFLGRSALRISGSLAFAIAVQLLVYFFSPFALYRSVGVATEPMTLLGCVVAGIALMEFLREPGEQHRERWVWIFVACSLFLVSSKLTTLPLLSLFALALPKWSQRLRYGVGLLVGFAALITLFSASRWEYYLSFVWSIFTKQGDYGSGTSGLDLVQFGFNMARIWKSDPQLVLVLFGSIGVFVVALFRGPIEWKRLVSSDAKHRIWIGVLVAMLGHLFVIGKQFRQHYLLSILVPLLLIAALWWISCDQHRRAQQLRWLCIVGMAALGVPQIYNASKVYVGTMQVKQASLRLLERADDFGPEAWVLSLNTSLTTSNAFRLTASYGGRSEISQVIQQKTQPSPVVSSFADLESLLAEHPDRTAVIYSYETDLHARIVELRCLESTPWGSMYVREAKSDF